MKKTAISNILATILIMLFILSSASFSMGKEINAHKATTIQDANESAIQVVEKFHLLLLESMKMGDNATCAQRYKLLAPYIKDHFDFPFISRIVLGRRHWKKMDQDTKRRFIDAFAKMTIATYAKRFDSYSGERFETVSSGSDKRGHFVVEAVLIKPDNEKIGFRYICRKVGNRWKIVSVSAKGVNDLSVKRADYNNFLKKHSVDELIYWLVAQSEKCLAEKK